MSNFTGQQINLTYKSILHFSNDNGLTVNTRFRLYDGAGVATCLQLAASGETPIFDTDVRVNEVLYPGEMGNQYDIMYQTDSDGTLAMGNIYDVLSFANGGQAVNGTISNIKSLTIQDGIIVGYTTAPTVHTFLLDLETFNPNVLSTAGSQGCNHNVYPYNQYGTSDYIYTAYYIPDALLIRDNYLDKIWSTNQLYPNPIYGSPVSGDYAIIITNPGNNTIDNDNNINQFQKMFGLQYKFNGTNWEWLRTWQVNPSYSVAKNDGRTTYDDGRVAIWSVANFGPVDYATPALSATSEFYYSRPRNNNGGIVPPGGTGVTNGGSNPDIVAAYNQIPASKILNTTYIRADGTIPGQGTTTSRNYGVILNLTLGKANLTTIGVIPKWPPSTSNAVNARNKYH